MTLREELAAFYRRCGFSDTADRQACTVPVYTGCLLVPLPNIETRHIYLKYHDLHHIVTGYDTDLVGEMEISAWELGAGCEDFVAAYVLNVGGLSGGAAIAPLRTLRAFARGRQSRSLYRHTDVEALLDGDVAAIRALTHVPSEPVPVRPSDVARFLAIATLGLFTWGVVLVPGLLLGPLLALYLSRAKARQGAGSAGTSAQLGG